MNQMILTGTKHISNKSELCNLIANQNFLPLASAEIRNFYILMQEKFNLSIYSTII